MRFTVNSTLFLEALSTVNRAVPSKTTLPILECILFERPGGPAEGLLLKGTDLEIGVVTKVEGVQFDMIDGKAGSEFSVAVPARRLLDTLRELPDGLSITFNLDEETFAVELSTDQGEYKMAGQDGQDYPDIPEPGEGSERGVKVGASAFARVVENTSFAASNDDLRPAMAGVNFEFSDEASRAVATDGHRLSRFTMTDGRLATEAPESAFSFILPQKAGQIARRVASDFAENKGGGDGEGKRVCSVQVGDGHARVEAGNTKVLARLVEEKYPNYESVIPDSNGKRVRVGREALLSATKRVGIYSSSTTNQIRFRIDPGEERIRIDAEDVERSSEAEETLRCECKPAPSSSGEGEEKEKGTEENPWEESGPLTIGFNADYLKEVLGATDAEDILMDLSSPNRAGIVRPDESALADDEDHLMLVMPVILNTYDYDGE